MALISSSVTLSSFAPTSLPPFQSRESCSLSIVSRPQHVVCSLLPSSSFGSINGLQSRRRPLQMVLMAPEEEKMTRRSPLDFPIEWERPKPGRRPDIFPQFSPMKTPLPPPLPADPPEEDEEEDEEKKEEEEDDPEKEEDPEKPDQ